MRRFHFMCLRFEIQDTIKPWCMTNVMSEDSRAQNVYSVCLYLSHSINVMRSKININLMLCFLPSVHKKTFLWLDKITSSAQPFQGWIFRIFLAKWNLVNAMTTFVSQTWMLGRFSFGWRWKEKHMFDCVCLCAVWCTIYCVHWSGEPNIFQFPTCEDAKLN